MADFCNNCMPGLDEMVGLTPPEDFYNGKAAIGLCEGCGPAPVDPEGFCLGQCSEFHKCRFCSSEFGCPYHFPLDNPREM